MKGIADPTEAQFTRMVIDLARLLGYRTAHFRPAMNAAGQWRTAVAGDAKGFPDLVLVGRGRLIFAELKCGKNKPTKEQLEWSESLRLAGQEFHFWRPAMWDELRTTLERNRP